MFTKLSAVVAVVALGIVACGSAYGTCDAARDLRDSYLAIDEADRLLEAGWSTQGSTARESAITGYFTDLRNVIGSLTSIRDQIDFESARGDLAALRDWAGSEAFWQEMLVLGFMDTPDGRDVLRELESSPDNDEIAQQAWNQVDDRLKDTLDTTLFLADADAVDTAARSCGVLLP